MLDKKKSTLKAHFYDALFYNTTKYSGEIRETEVLLWSSSYWLRGAYPIFHLHFDKNNHLSRISTQSNPFGKIVFCFIILGTLLFALAPIIGYGFPEGLPLSIFVIIIGFFLFLIMRKVKKQETKIMTEELRESIEQIEREKFPEKFAGQTKKEILKENEWTVKKIFTRIILYPFTLLIIYISITGLILQGKIGKGIFGILICSAYLYSDLYAVFKKVNKSKD